MKEHRGKQTTIEKYQIAIGGAAQCIHPTITMVSTQLCSQVKFVGRSQSVPLTALLLLDFLLEYTNLILSWSQGVPTLGHKS